MVLFLEAVNTAFGVYNDLPLRTVENGVAVVADVYTHLRLGGAGNKAVTALVAGDGQDVILGVNVLFHRRGAIRDFN